MDVTEFGEIIQIYNIKLLLITIIYMNYKRTNNSLF